jgi:hypothetical protein
MAFMGARDDGDGARLGRGDKTNQASVASSLHFSATSQGTTVFACSATIRSHMKRFVSSSLFAIALGVAAFPVFASSLFAAEAGEYDFGEFVPPQNSGEFVEVNLTRDLIAIAGKLVAKQEPDVSALLAGLHGVRVHVIGVDDANRTTLTKRIVDARADLTKRGWQHTVSVREKDQAVDVFVKTHGDETIDGIVVTVLGDKEQAVFVNVVGNIKPEQLAMLGERFGIDPLKHIRAETGG